MRTVAINAALERTLTRERLRKYLEAANQDLDAAIALYEKNTRLSEAFYTPLQSLEICLRNCLTRELSLRYGDTWFGDPSVPLNDHSRRMISEAIQELRRSRREMLQGRVIAELKFSFWVGLLGPHYDATLWRTCLYKAFLVGGGKPRKTVHSRLNALRRFRNRIAHHEPILHHDVVATHTEIIETIGWMCRHTAAWAGSNSRVPDVL
ncbi:Abi family protein [Rhodopseudomonas palustris]|uniref:Abi family protein n=1 Tax=Rhodopseudomonas palustris TaxID=1076 RepID=UPI002ACE983D|nr:Abi family protein [Rhodopseudomonas palustris]WQG98994.1 Abi family protein [Rhodopseudomonas palustris]